MRKLVVGILAHVDAGKTTLSEGLLYRGGALKKPGRVDHRDAFLDTEDLERERGITIFSKQAVLTAGDVEISLVDTPGHVDFSAEAERVLGVLDCAVLVVSGTDGVQGHTETLWRLLGRYGVPTLLFINKMDLPGADRGALLGELKRRLDDACIDFGAAGDALYEPIATCGEEALEQYLDRGAVEDGAVSALIGARRLFPCFFGSALRLDGVEELLAGIARWAPRTEYGPDFGARVYKIARDPQGTRLSCLKVTGGTLRVKDALRGEGWEEKADQLRIYSGARYRAVDMAEAGTVCAVAGLSRTYPGQGLGIEEEAEPPALESVLSYRVDLPDGCDAQSALAKLRTLEEEDPQLHVDWNGPLREIHVRLMGEIQLEILKRIILERFGLEVGFSSGGIVYRETIAAPVEGVGHYEPLRHYAEVHLLLEPGERGSGLRCATALSTDELDIVWQKLILTHVEERSHPGALTGAPVTDLKITLVAGRGHLKHTEGGDFRQATYRAVRQGLMQAENVLLEPWYAFRLEVPAECVGRAMSDVQRMGGRCEAPETQGESVLLTGAAPVSAMRSYAAEVTAYTRGRGRLSCALKGYEPCVNQAEVVAALGYDPERDVENTPDSVFCAHGAGFSVKWDRVREHMHVDSGIRFGVTEEPEEKAAPVRRPSYSGMAAEDKELAAIFERTYGPVKRRDFRSPPKPREESAEAAVRQVAPPRYAGPEYLLVDGYNIIFAWDELKRVARESLDAARQMLLDILSNYRAFKDCEIILVFDAYKVKGGAGAVERYHGIHVVYTKEAETADAYIERTTYELGREHRVRVATSDALEQLIILGHGALRLSARAFHQEVVQAAGQISAILAQNNRREKNRGVGAAMERAEQAKP